MMRKQEQISTNTMQKIHSVVHTVIHIYHNLFICAFVCLQVSGHSEEDHRQRRRCHFGENSQIKELNAIKVCVLCNNHQELVA